MSIKLTDNLLPGDTVTAHSRALRDSWQQISPTKIVDKVVERTDVPDYFRYKFFNVEYTDGTIETHGEYITFKVQ